MCGSDAPNKESQDKNHFSKKGGSAYKKSGSGHDNDGLVFDAVEKTYVPEETAASRLSHEEGESHRGLKLVDLQAEKDRMLISIGDVLGVVR